MHKKLYGKIKGGEGVGGGDEEKSGDVRNLYQERVHKEKKAVDFSPGGVAEKEATPGAGVGTGIEGTTTRGQIGFFDNNRLITKRK